MLSALVIPWQVPIVEPIIVALGKTLSEPDTCADDSEAHGIAHAAGEHQVPHEIPARAEAGTFPRLDALLFTVTDWIFIPAYCFAIS